MGQALLKTATQDEPAEYAEWSASDISQAKDSLIDAIHDGEEWDEDGEYKIDLMIDVERILTDAEDDKLGRINDARYLAIRQFAKYAVELDADTYCERFCS